MSLANQCILQRVGVLVAAVAGLLSLAGCASKAEVVLHQPFAPLSQRSLELVGEWAYRGTSGDRQTCVLAFPLPRAVDGPRAFVIYASASNQPGKVPVAPNDPAGACGFLIQEVGALAGRSDFVAGTLRFRDVWLAPRLRQVDLDVRTDDGTEISGRAIVETAPTEVHAFQREFAADIARLSLPQSQPARGKQTGRRGSAAR